MDLYNPLEKIDTAMKNVSDNALMCTFLNSKNVLNFLHYINDLLALSYI